MEAPSGGSGGGRRRELREYWSVWSEPPGKRKGEPPFQIFVAHHRSPIGFARNFGGLKGRRIVIHQITLQMLERESAGYHNLFMDSFRGDLEEASEHFKHAHHATSPEEALRTVARVVHRHMAGNTEKETVYGYVARHGLQHILENTPEHYTANQRKLLEKLAEMLDTFQEMRVEED
jgi:hypothetical protein